MSLGLLFVKWNKYINVTGLLLELNAFCHLKPREDFLVVEFNMQ